MAKNRTEAIAAVLAALVPTLTLAELIALWNNELNDTYLFRKDIIASETPSAGAVTIDYSNKDTATVTTGVNLAVSFTNIENGDVKYLVITKAATNSISFAGATDITEYPTYINNIPILVPYQIFNKNGAIYAKAMIASIINGGAGGIFAADFKSFPNSQAVKEWQEGQVAPWQNPSYNANFSAGTFPLQFRTINTGVFGTMLQLRGDMLTTASSGAAFTLPGSSRPATHRADTFIKPPSGVGVVHITDSGLGVVESTSWSTTDDNKFNITMPLD